LKNVLGRPTQASQQRLFPILFPCLPMAVVVAIALAVPAATNACKRPGFF